MTRQSMYLFYLLPFLLMNSAHTWFNVEPDTVKLSNPTVDCVNYLNTQLNVFEPPTTGIDWTYGMLESNIENINCAVVYSYSDKIVFIDDDFEKDVSLQNVHHMNTVPSLSQNVIDVLKENKKVFFVESYYPQPNWFFRGDIIC